MQNVYDTPHEETELAQPSNQNNDNDDMLKDLGLEPNDDVYESPVWSDSDVDSWGEDSNIKAGQGKPLIVSNNEEKSVEKAKLSMSIKDNISVSSTSAPDYALEEGSGDNKVLALRLVRLQKNYFALRF